MEDAGLLAAHRWQADGDGDGGWSFKVGECVHLKGNTSEAEGIITRRLRLVDGGWLYEVLKIFDDDGDFGFASEESIRSVEHGGQYCVECPLLNSSVCPRGRMQ